MKENVHKMSLRLLLVLLLPFNALLAQSPSITSFSPSAGDVGSTLTIKGSNFKNVTKVWFGPAPASFTTINDSTITAVVPDNSYLGNIAVATIFGYTIGTNYFMVKNPQNVIIGNNDQTSSYYLKNGKLYGLNSYNYDNGYQYRNCPVEMPSKGSLRGKTISQISNSGIHFIALASDNSVHAWGFNSKGQLGDSSSFASARGATVDITNKGGIKGKKVIQVLAGSYTSYALTSDGQVFSWGQDTLGALGNGAATNGVVRVPTSISGYGSLVGKTIIKLCKTTHASDYSNIFAIASDGTVHAWGSNQTSNLGTGNNNVVEEPVIINQTGVLAGKTIVEIDVSFSSTLLIDKDGLIYGMGYTGALGLPGSTQATPIELDMASGSSLYQKRALTVLASKRLPSGHVLDTAGALHSFGLNTFGNLGDGTFDFKPRPVLVNATNSSITGKRIVGIANGDYCTYLLASDNTMHAFGSANNYALMNGLNTPNASKAIPIKTLLPPLLDATNINIKSITQNSATISCTKGSGMGRLIVLKALNSIDTIALANGISYTAAAVQPGGSLIDTTGNVIYLGNGDTVSVSGLISNTLYHIAIFEFDTFSSPCSYHVFKLGSPLAGSFTTLDGSQLPIVNTSSPLEITLNSATLGGNVISIGSATVTERGVVLATAANPTTANTKITIGNGLGNFSQNITALTPSTTYHFRAFAINSFGTSYGADSLFTTLPNSAFNKNIVNAFSPDGDGTNDTWVIDNADMLNGHEINVYNIFGQLVFTQTGYNIPWDGKKDGDLVPSGEYYYQIKGDKVNIKGALLIKTHQ